MGLRPKILIQQAHRTQDHPHEISKPALLFVFFTTKEREREKEQLFVFSSKEEKTLRNCPQEVGEEETESVVCWGTTVP